MTQARRNSDGGERGGVFAGLGMLVAGMVIGSLATVLVLGALAGGEVGGGLRHLLQQAKQEEADAPAESAAEAAAAEYPQNAQTAPFSFDFHTVLPGIEVVVTEAPADQPSENTTTDEDADDSKPEAVYMLQAASYARQEEAETLRANLALRGLTSFIQKVSIQGEGDRYRVRLGPFASFAEMEKAEMQLARAGIRDALLLKVSG